MDDYQHTDREKLFIRRWKKNFDTSPRDWTPRALNRGTSSFLDWAEWLAKDDINIDAVLTILDKFDAPPTLKKVAFEYSRLGIFGPQDTKPSDCGDCDNTGIRFVVWHNIAGKHKIADPRSQKSEMLRPVISTCPCACCRGRRHADSWGLAKDDVRRNDMIERLQAISFRDRIQAERWMLYRQQPGHIEQADLPDPVPGPSPQSDDVDF